MSERRPDERSAVEKFRDFQKSGGCNACHYADTYSNALGTAAVLEVLEEIRDRLDAITGQVEGE